MPGFDGTGPLGEGPMTGGGDGNCTSDQSTSQEKTNLEENLDTPPPVRDEQDFVPLGRGRRMRGRGMGMGRGRGGRGRCGRGGRGMGFGNGVGRGRLS